MDSDLSCLSRFDRISNNSLKMEQQSHQQMWVLRRPDTQTQRQLECVHVEDLHSEHTAAAQTLTNKPYLLMFSLAIPFLDATLTRAAIHLRGTCIPPCLPVPRTLRLNVHTDGTCDKPDKPTNVWFRRAAWAVVVCPHDNQQDPAWPWRISPSRLTYRLVPKSVQR